MAGVGAIVHLDGRPVEPAALTRMLAVAVHRGPDGVGTWVDGSVGVGQLAHWVHPEDIGVVDPYTDSSVVVAADCRLDDRKALAQRLRVDAAAPDTTLIAAAYRRWGDRFAGELLGDFAIVVWDRDEKRMVLARDPMAVRPLYFRFEPTRRLVVGSEVAQMTEGADVPRHVDEVQLAAFLHGPYGFRERSAVAGIDQVVPGEVTVIESSGPVRRSPFWSLDPERRVRYCDGQEYGEALRELLLAAVADRCRGRRPPALLLSGGIDSGAIALTAGQLALDGTTLAPKAYTWSFEELRACDERAVAAVMAGNGGLALSTIPADDAYPLADHPRVAPPIDSPASWPFADLFDRTYDRIADEGADVVLTGSRGDEVIGAQVWDFVGLVRDRRFGELGARLDGVSGSRRRRWRVAARTIRDEVGYPPRVSNGPALGPALRNSIDMDALRQAEQLRAGSAISRARRQRHQRIFGYAAQQLTALDAREIAAHGMQLADPWTDRRVIEWVCAIPQYEVTRPDRPKDLLRRTLDPWRPPDTEFLRGTGLGPLYDRGFRERSADLIAHLFATSRLAACGYIDGPAYVRMASEVRAGENRPMFEWALAAERWFRRHWPESGAR